MTLAKNMKHFPAIISVIGITLTIVGIFLMSCQQAVLAGYRDTVKVWTNQVYEQTYASGYKDGDEVSGGSLIVSLKVNPDHISYNMHSIKHAEKPFLPLVYQLGITGLGLILVVVGCFQSGKLSKKTD